MIAHARRGTGLGGLDASGVIAALVGMCWSARLGTPQIGGESDPAMRKVALGSCYVALSQRVGVDAVDYARLHRTARVQAETCGSRLDRLLRAPEYRQLGAWTVAWEHPSCAAAFAACTREHLVVALRQSTLGAVLAEGAPEVLLRTAAGDGVLAVASGALHVVPSGGSPAVRVAA